MSVDKHGYDPDNYRNSGYNDWNDLPEVYKERADIIFQEVENSNNARVKLFQCVKAPVEGDYSDLLNKVYDEITMWTVVEETEHGPVGELECEVVWLSGKFDDSPPNNKIIGEDDINRSKLNDFKNVERW